MSVVAVTPGGEAERAGLHVGDIVAEIQGKPASEGIQPADGPDECWRCDNPVKIRCAEAPNDNCNGK